MSLQLQPYLDDILVPQPSTCTPLDGPSMLLDHHFLCPGFYDTLHTMTQTSYHIEDADTQHMTAQSSRKTSNYTRWQIVLAHYYNHSCMWVSCHKHMQLLEITLVHYCREIIMSKYHAQKTEKLLHKITRRSLASGVCIILICKDKDKNEMCVGTNQN